VFNGLYITSLYVSKVQSFYIFTTSRKQYISILLENDTLYLLRFVQCVLFNAYFKGYLYLFQNAKAFCILSLCGFPAIIAAGYTRCAIKTWELFKFDLSLVLSNILAVRLTFPVGRNLLLLLNILVSVFSLITAKL